MVWSESFRITPPWWQAQGDIVASSRARFVRNIEGKKFPMRLSSSEKQGILHDIEVALKETVSEFKSIGINSVIKRNFFTERHILNHESTQGAHIFTSHTEEESYIINDRDHLRVQITLPNFSLKDVFAMARQRMRFIESEFNFSYNDSFGYLTSSLTSTGTGFRLSVLMFVPGIFLARETEKILALLVKAPIILRGILGGRSEIKGNYIQISTKFTIGIGLEDTLKMLEYVVKTLLETEKKSRDALLASARLELEDRVGRSLAILERARIIDYDEALEHLSILKFASQIGFEGVPPEQVLNKMILWSAPSHLASRENFEIKDDEMDIKRARLLRDWLGEE